MEMLNVKTFVLCRDAGGSPDFFVTDVCLPRSSYDLGDHYDIATKRAEEAGYESPMEPFDENEPAGRALASVFAKKFGHTGTSLLPTILVWAGEGGVEEVIADFPLRYVVVTTDTEYADDDCVFEINTGKEIHEVLGHTGVSTVNQYEAGFVWNQVRRLAEPDLDQPVNYDDVEEIPAELSFALGFKNPDQMKEHQRFLDALIKHRIRFRRMLGKHGAGE